jgi:KaiC/GvpD/RAD55 family RecA-like ATPase
VSKCFVIDADVVKTYEAAHDFFLTLGYSEQSAIKPTLLVLKKRGSIGEDTTQKIDNLRVNLRISLNPVGNMQIYATSLLTVRFEYEIKTSEETNPNAARTIFETEVEKFRCKIIKGTTFETETEKSRCTNIETCPIDLSPKSPSPSKTLSSSQEKPTSPEKLEHPEIQAKLSQETNETKRAPNILPGRISSGYEELDNLLFGGIPEKYSVVMLSPSSDERDFLIEKFLEAGVKRNETTFDITEDPTKSSNLIKEDQPNFYLFITNPRAETIAPNLPNVYKLKGVENLTEIEIAMVKAFRTLDASNKATRRACLEILSDVLLQHRAVLTRKWLSGLLMDLKSKGFTTLAIVNPNMHPPEDVHAILGLFQGEIRIYEKETEKGIEKVLRIRKLINQRHSEKELILTKEKIRPAS